MFLPESQLKTSTGSVQMLRSNWVFAYEQGKIIGYQFFSIQTWPFISYTAICNKITEIKSI